MNRTILCSLSTLFLMPTLAFAHSSSVSISSPSDGQVYETDTIPLSVPVEGSVTHANPGNANGMTVCVAVDGDTPVCEDDCEGLGNTATCNYSVAVGLGYGVHTIQVSASKDGAHGGISNTITVTVNRSVVACDETDPPAHANAYMNGMALPQEYAQMRGKVIRQIANAHSDGKYGSCTYDYDCVETDVDAALAGAALPESCD